MVKIKRFICGPIVEGKYFSWSSYWFSNLVSVKNELFNPVDRLSQRLPKTRSPEDPGPGHSFPLHLAGPSGAGPSFFRPI